MSLLAIIISLLVERYYEGVQAIKHYGWFDRYGVWLAGIFKGKVILDGSVGLIIILLPVVMVTGFLQDALTRGSPLLGYLFAIAVLIYCLGPRRLRSQVTSYINSRNNDDRESVRAVASEITGEAPADELQDQDKAVVEAILTQINDRVLTVIFWFFILGPVGALIYRLTHLLVRDAARDEGGFGEGLLDAALRLRGILDWLPARITAWSYALMGAFTEARHNWQIRAFEWLDNWVAGNRGVLIASGTGALRIDAGLREQDAQQTARDYNLEAVKAALDLVGRATAAWLVVIALVTLAGWSVA